MIWGFEKYTELWSLVQGYLQYHEHIAHDVAKALPVELYRGLICKTFVEDPLSLSFPPLVDAAWHGAILNTREYAQFCLEEFGQVLQHRTSTVEDSLAEKNKRVDQTVAIYISLFRCSPPASLWKREEPRPRRQPKRACKRKRIEKTLVSKRKQYRPQTFQLFFKKLDGTTVSLKVTEQMTLSTAVKILLSRKLIVTDDVRLIYAGRVLEFEQTCGKAGLKPDNTIHVVHRLRGC